MQAKERKTSKQGGIQKTFFPYAKQCFQYLADCTYWKITIISGAELTMITIMMTTITQ